VTVGVAPLPPISDEREFPRDNPPNAPKRGPGRPRGASSSKSTGSSSRSSARSGSKPIPLTEQLQIPYRIAGTALASRLPATSHALYAQAGPCAAAWDTFLRRWPELHEMIEKGMIAGDIVGLIMAHLPIITAARGEAQVIAEARARAEAEAQRATGQG
jgi:hypothetical protein